MSAEGMAACSEQIFWASHAELVPEGSASTAQVDVADWLKPSSGPKSVKLALDGTEYSSEVWQSTSLLVLVPKPGSNRRLYAMPAGEAANSVAAEADTSLECSTNT